MAELKVLLVLLMLLQNLVSFGYNIIWAQSNIISAPAVGKDLILYGKNMYC